MRGDYRPRLVLAIPVRPARPTNDGYQMSWTDERIATLTKMWEGGATASQLAHEAGGVSRNAVIGKAHRLGLKARPSPVNAKEPKPAPATRSEAEARPAPRVAKPSRPAAPPVEREDDEDEAFGASPDIPSQPLPN